MVRISVSSAEADGAGAVSSRTKTPLPCRPITGSSARRTPAAGFLAGLRQQAQVMVPDAADRLVLAVANA